MAAFSQGKAKVKTFIIWLVLSFVGLLAIHYVVSLGGFPIMVEFAGAAFLAGVGVFAVIRSAS